jgi:hypothetical protein
VLVGGIDTILVALIRRRLFPKLFRTEAPEVLTRQAYRPAATARERWLPAT